MSTVEPTAVVTGNLSAWSTASPWRRARHRFFHQPAGIIGTAMLAVFVLMGIAPSLVAPHNPLHSYASYTLHAPDGRFLLGTDPIGRDVLSRIIYGARPALIVGLAAVAIGAVIGALSGLAAGFNNGPASNAMMRVWDGVFAVPAVVFGLILAATFGDGVTTVAIAVGFCTAPPLARIARAAALAQAELGYVEAGEALGFSRIRIFFRDVLPNSLSPIIVQLALTMAFAVLLESALAFLGVGTQPPAASWGGMLSDSENYLGAWWYAVFPGIAITLLVLSINLVADAARDALDPRTDSDR